MGLHGSRTYDEQDNGGTCIIRSFESRLLEVFDALWDDLVDPREAYADADGGWWLPVAAGGNASPRPDCAVNEQSLRELRMQCRGLAATNEFAINGHENRISYIVGPGHSYRATICKGMEASHDVAMQVQKLLDRFQQENRWQLRQQEIVHRIDRDGETFLRFFVDPEGTTRVRFIEPDQVATPSRAGRRCLGQLRHSNRCGRCGERARLLRRRRVHRNG